MDALVVELSKEGTVTLPESVWQDLPPGTCILVHRRKDSIILQATKDALPARYDLGREAFEFTNELIAEERQEYLVQIALANESQE